MSAPPDGSPGAGHTGASQTGEGGIAEDHMASAPTPGGETICSACDGSGRTDSGECPACGGTGTVDEPAGGA